MLREPERSLSLDPAEKRRLAALEPRLVAFGHGPSLRDPRMFTRFIAGLAD